MSTSPPNVLRHKNKRTVVGMAYGHRYCLTYDRLGNQLTCDAKHAHKWLWFLAIDGEYCGNFLRKRDAMQYMAGKI